MPDTLIHALAAEPWAIQPDWLQAIWAIATRQPHLSEKIRADWLECNLLAAMGSGAKRLQGARYAVVEDGIAVVPVFGLMFSRANMMTEMSGATSADMLMHDIGLSLSNPNVHAIMLLIDSPGGAISGMERYDPQPRDRRHCQAHRHLEHPVRRDQRVPGDPERLRYTRLEG